jgi:hypothetical protein
MSIKKSIPTPLQPNKQITNRNRIREWTIATLNRLAATFRGSQNNYNASQQQAIQTLHKILDIFFKDAGQVGPLDRMIRQSGLFYIMGYDAKTYYELKFNPETRKIQRKLPYFDAMPLIFVIHVDHKGFLALNFHWLNPKFRMFVLQRMVANYPKPFFYDQRIAPMNWNIFANALGPLRTAMVRSKAIRRYSWNRIRRIKGIKINRIPFNLILDCVNYTSPLLIGLTESRLQQMLNLRR